MTSNLFVYGTLKQDGRLTLARFPGAKFVSRAETIEELHGMISLGSFPGVIPGNSRVVGEVWEVDRDTKQQVDRIEGYPTFYNRQIVDTTAGPAWMYYLTDSDFPNEEVVQPNKQNTVEWFND